MSRTKKNSPPALTIQEREDEMIGLAVDLAEELLRNGEAPSQIITHYLKLGSSREKMEQERIKMENELARAKTKSILSGEELEKMYSEAIKAFGIYSGKEMEEGDDFEYECGPDIF